MTNNMITDERVQGAAAEADRVAEPCTLVLFGAEREELLLQQIRRVSLGDYQAGCIRLVEAEVLRQFFRRLHHDPMKTIQTLIEQHSIHYNELHKNQAPPIQEGLASHTY